MASRGKTTNFREGSTSLARVRLVKGKLVELDDLRSFESSAITYGAIKKNHVLVLPATVGSESSLPGKTAMNLETHQYVGARIVQPLFRPISVSS